MRLRESGPRRISGCLVPRATGAALALRLVAGGGVRLLRLLVVGGVETRALEREGAGAHYLAHLVPTVVRVERGIADPLEYLEAAFYAGAVSGGKFSGKVGAFARVVAKHEADHVAFLKGALGSAAVKSPKFDFKGTNTDMAKFMATAEVLEDTGVAAYLGQAGNIKSKKILGAAGSILAVEARHAGWIRDLNNQPGAPSAFQAPKTKAQVLAAVKSTGFIVG